MQEQSEENRIVAKSRLTAMDLTSSVAASSSPVNSPISSRSSGILKVSSRQVGLSGRLDEIMNQNSNPDAASSSQGWQRDAQQFFITGKQTCANGHGSELSESAGRTRQHRETNLWQRWRLNTKDVQENSKFQKIQEIQHLKVEFGNVEKVFLIVRKIYDQKPTDKLKDLDVNTAIWCVFMSLDEFAIRQKSIFEVCGTIIPDNWEVDQRADGDDRSVYDQLRPAYVERIVSFVW